MPTILKTQLLNNHWIFFCPIVYRSYQILISDVVKFGDKIFFSYIRQGAEFLFSYYFYLNTFVFVFYNVTNYHKLYQFIISVL